MELTKIRSIATRNHSSSWRNVLQLRRHRAKIPPIEICAPPKRNEFRSAVFDLVAERAPGQESDLVAIGEQNARDRKQRIDMARRRRRSDKNLHDIGPLIADKRAYVGLPMEATPSGAKSPRPRSRANVQHGERARLRESFRDWILRYGCNGVAAIVCFADWSCPGLVDGLGLRRVCLGHHVSFRIRWARDSPRAEWRRDGL